MREWWYWYKELVCAAVVICIMVVLLLCALNNENEEKKAKFNKCMADIHNVYVCETWARGKDVEFYYIPTN